MDRAVYSTMPVHILIQEMEYMLKEEVKPNMVALLDIHTEHFWRTKGLPGYPFYKPAVAEVLRRNNIVLPFTIEGFFCIFFLENLSSTKREPYFYYY
jgi:hypothetical protein